MVQGKGSCILSSNADEGQSDSVGGKDDVGGVSACGVERKGLGKTAHNKYSDLDAKNVFFGGGQVDFYREGKAKSVRASGIGGGVNGGFRKQVQLNSRVGGLNKSNNLYGGGAKCIENFNKNPFNQTVHIPNRRNLMSGRNPGNSTLNFPENLVSRSTEKGLAKECPLVSNNLSGYININNVTQQRIMNNANHAVQFPQNKTDSIIDNMTKSQKSQLSSKLRNNGVAPVHQILTSYNQKNTGAASKIVNGVHSNKYSLNVANKSLMNRGSSEGKKRIRSLMENLARIKDTQNNFTKNIQEIADDTHEKPKKQIPTSILHNNKKSTSNIQPITKFKNLHELFKSKSYRSTSEDHNTSFRLNQTQKIDPKYHKNVLKKDANSNSMINLSINRDKKRPQTPGLTRNRSMEIQPTSHPQKTPDLKISFSVRTRKGKSSSPSKVNQDSFITNMNFRNKKDWH